MQLEVIQKYNQEDISFRWRPATGRAWGKCLLSTILTIFPATSTV